MGFPQLVFIFVVMVSAMSYFSAKKLDRQLFITMWTNVDTKEEFLVDRRSRYFYYQGQKFDIVPSCCRPMRWKRGIHVIIPTTVQVAEYTWSDTLPIHPDTGRVVIVSPESRAAMDAEELFTNMNRSTKKIEGKKESGLQRYLPVIAIVVVALVAVYLYMQMKGLDNSITLLGEYFKQHLNGVGGVTP
jgi:hypothetical protein